MKKLSLFLSLVILLTVLSCDKSIQTEGLFESTEQNLEHTLVKGENTIPILPGATTMDIKLPDGQVITMDIPVQFQLNEDGTPKADRPATYRSWNGDCQNTVIVYPYSNDSFTQSNVNSVTIKYAGYPVSTTGVNQSTSSGSIGLDPGDIITVTVDTDASSGCNDILLIVGSWNCGGGQFHQMQLDFAGDIANINLGALSICNNKCGLNPNWTSLSFGGC